MGRDLNRVMFPLGSGWMKNSPRSRDLMTNPEYPLGLVMVKFAVKIVWFDPAALYACML